MKKFNSFMIVCAVMALSGPACKKSYPVDEDGLLITTRAECYVSSFELLGTDYVTVRSKTAVIDTMAQTVRVEVLFGTDLKNLYPQFSLASDCKLDPKIIGRTDLSDTLNPKTYTVISGSRQIKKPYKLYVSMQR